MLAVRRALRAAVAAATLLAAGGCATITRGVTQDVQIATDPAGAACELKREDGEVLDAIAVTPGYVRIRKGLNTYVVGCRLTRYLDATTTLEASVEHDGSAAPRWARSPGCRARRAAR